MFNPDTLPMNMAWFTGHLTTKEMEEEHPLELERIEREHAAGKGGAAEPPAVPPVVPVLKPEP